MNNLKDITGRGRIRNKITKLRLGYLSGCRSLGEDLFEIKFYFGPGCRIYFGKDEENKIVLLYGGDKSSQRRDIVKAKKFWKTYKGG